MPRQNGNTKGEENKDLSMSEKIILPSFLSGYALQTNINHIFSANTIFPTLNGVRSIAAIWILLGHTFCFAFGATDNLLLGFTYADEILLQPFLSSMVAIDLFFVLGSFLLSYSFFEQQKANPSCNVWTLAMKKIVTRFLRMAPVIAVVGEIINFLNTLIELVMLVGSNDECRHGHVYQ